MPSKNFVNVYKGGFNLTSPPSDSPIRGHFLIKIVIHIYTTKIGLQGEHFYYVLYKQFDTSDIKLLLKLVSTG